MSDIAFPTWTTDSSLNSTDRVLVDDGTTTIKDVAASDFLDTDNHTSGTTNKVYTATEQTKLSGIEAWADVTDTANVTAAWALMDSEVTNLAQVKAFNSSDYAAALHTHTASQITDFDTEVSNNATVAGKLDDVVAGTNITIDKTNPNNPIINSTGGGATDLDSLTDVTIATPSNGQALIYNSTSWDWENTTLWGGWDMLASTYDPTSVAWDAFSMDNMVEWTDTKILTAAERTKLTNTSGTNTGDQTITLTGDVTGSGTWSFATTIADEAVTLAKMAHIATNRILGRATAGTGDVEALADGDVRDIIGLATTDSPQFTGIELGHPTDTTIGRTSAGVINVEGDDVLMNSDIGSSVQAYDANNTTASNTQTLTNKTLTDPKITTSINTQTGTTYTLVLTDASKLLRFTNASAIDLTIPTNASVPFPIGTQTDLAQQWDWAITIWGTGITINSKDGNKTSNWKWVWLTLIKVWTDEWDLFGDLTT